MHYDSFGFVDEGSDQALQLIDPVASLAVLRGDNVEQSSRCRCACKRLPSQDCDSMGMSIKSLNFVKQTNQHALGTEAREEFAEPSLTAYLVAEVSITIVAVSLTLEAR
ncbi:hypothetical protein AWB79_05031 [Caballeronia hypogeia]|uniref:Uncharacterized protein n=1 Tax=Caballeronia hypogeia TaxID=1777140 RepID=A0A158CAU1_9BURK|nr:hypothetical protein [Caballeronia hypogeia]SAK79419.1 hypothetical protein AWB79_05031 [Caballeronia hypogeia]